VNPVPNVLPAYPHMSRVEYFSCTHYRCLQAVVTLDALDRYLHWSRRMEDVIYVVHLARTRQFRTTCACRWRSDTSSRCPSAAEGRGKL